LSNSRASRVKLSPRFERSLRKLDPRLRTAAVKALKTLILEPDSRSLKLEPVTGLSGFWTIRVNIHFRILLEQLSDGDGKYFLAVDVGNHDIYRK
jgi:mRNA-degrading endonuclease RelE of RelBE toxin-antitoxin system